MPIKSGNCWHTLSNCIRKTSQSSRWTADISPIFAGIWPMLETPRNFSNRFSRVPTPRKENTNQWHPPSTNHELDKMVVFFRWCLVPLCLKNSVETPLHPTTICGKNCVTLDPSRPPTTRDQTSTWHWAEWDQHLQVELWLTYHYFSSTDSSGFLFQSLMPAKSQESIVKFQKKSRIFQNCFGFLLRKRINSIPVT